MLIPAEAKPFYPLEISPDEKQVISSNRAPGETGASLYLYNLDTYESKCLFPGSPEDTVFPLGWLDDNTLLIGPAVRLRRSDAGRADLPPGVCLQRRLCPHRAGRVGGLYL